jgi:DeoR/GlpR family transcriptional regulator of sugar metabolism
MLKEERHHRILDRLSADKRVSLVGLSKDLNVSYDSIRRDVIELAERGLLRKVHGGAITNAHLPMKVRQKLGIPNEEFATLARKAVSLLRNGQTVLMDGGTTPLYLIEHFPKDLELTIVTNNLPLATALVQHPKIEVVLLGGSFYKPYQISTGQVVLDQLQSLRVDWYFLGAVGIDAEEGLSVRYYEESLLKRQMMSYARRVVTCVTQEKLDNPAPCRICGLEDLSVLVTPLEPDAPELAGYRVRNVEIY